MTVTNNMEVDAPSTNQDVNFHYDRDKIIDFLTNNSQIIFKQQQIGETDLVKSEKAEIAVKIYEKSKINFLNKFGRFLNIDHLDYFKQFSVDNEEIDLILQQLITEETHRNKNVKNRRYEALKHLIEEDDYFSDIEMMKRNPSLYEQLVGQYMTNDEIYERDKYKMEEGTTFVKILMEGIERNDAEEIRKQEESAENNAEIENSDQSDEDMSNSSDDPPPSTSRWGEFEDSKKIAPKPKRPVPTITAEERKLLKEEFITSMYQSFLDGNDKEFDYTTVDNNNKYDNMDQINHDAEDEYFDSEDPETVEEGDRLEVSSEDELDIYMSALNDHPAVKQLSVDMKKL